MKPSHICSSTSWTHPCFILPGKESHGHGLISIFTLQETFPKAQQCQPPLSFIVCLVLGMKPSVLHMLGKR